MTTLQECRSLGPCPGCCDVPGFTPECGLCGGSGLVRRYISCTSEFWLRPTIDPNAVRMVRKHPAERNREKARRRARRGK